MMWLLLFALTLVVVLLPMLPAFLEWRRPSDVVPLHIDSQDALDPAFLAHSFALQLVAALAHKQLRLGQSRLLPVPASGSWLQSQAELREGASRHVWHGSGDVRLPPDADLLGEVASTGDLHSAAGRVYRALWAGGVLRLAPQSTVLRWAHGQQVVVAPGCRLAGRISAEQDLTLASGVSFSLLHAPVVRFGPDNSRSVAVPSAATDAAARSLRLGLPDEVHWDAVAGRGTCVQALHIGPGRAWRGDLVCQDDLLIGRHCRVRGSVKSWGALRLEVGGRVVGNLVAIGRIVLGADCVVQGAVVSETAVLLGPGCVVGAPGAPATVTAPRIVVEAGVTVYGTLWAGEHGSTPAVPAPAQATPDDLDERDEGQDNVGPHHVDPDDVWPQQVWA